VQPNAAELLRAARLGARLSQNELARRADVAQSVISAYESGRREPGLPTLVRLVEATGHGLSIDLVRLPGHVPGLPDTPLARRLRRQRQAILGIAARRGVRNVRVFGSVARGDDRPSSDIDLLVDVDGNVSILDLIGLERELTDLLHLDVDVVPADSLKPRVAAQVLGEAVAL